MMSGLGLNSTVPPFADHRDFSPFAGRPDGKLAPVRIARAIDGALDPVAACQCKNLFKRIRAGYENVVGKFFFLRDACSARA